MDISTLNIWAVLAATLLTFVIGAIWYGPLFGNIWMKTVGLSEDEINEGNMAKIFGLAFIFELIMAFCLAMFLNDPSIGISEGTFYGFLTGFGWIFFALAVNALYERRSWKYIFINGGYWVVTFTLMGLILGAWK